LYGRVLAGRWLPTITGVTKRECTSGAGQTRVAASRIGASVRPSDTLRGAQFGRYPPRIPKPSTPESKTPPFSDEARVAKTWHELSGLRGHGSGPRSEPGARGMCLHPMIFDPRDPGRMFIAISAAGAFRTDDAGKTWGPIKARRGSRRGGSRARRRSHTALHIHHPARSRPAIRCACGTICDRGTHQCRPFLRFFSV
jgi:hypothetical protein